MSFVSNYVDMRRGKGFGYRLTESGFICMTRCFECGTENYGPAVSSGFCAFCGHDANKKETKHEKKKD